jgi:cytochrome c-type biogenesis protein CcmH/NrfG
MKTRALLPLVLLLPALASAQDVTTAVGIVLGPDGSPLAEASVVLHYKGHLDKTYPTKTDKSGRFLYVKVFTGPHDITISKEGLGEIVVKDFTFHDLAQFEKPPTFKFAQRKVAEPAAGGAAPGAPGPAPGGGAGELAALNQKLAAGQVDEALAGYEALAAKDPGSSAVHRMLGNAAKKKGDAARAETELRKAVELDPNDALAHRDLGVFLYESGRGAEAIEQGRAALEDRPGDAMLLTNLGLMYQSAGRAQDAWDTLLKAEAADPSNAELQYHLGIVAVSLNKPAECVARLQKYLAASPADEQKVATAKGLVAALSPKK